MRLAALHRKIVRDAWALRGQVFACALVLAAGISSFVSLHSVNLALAGSQQAFYLHHRFADVFASLTRAPEPLRRELAEIAGVAALETRVVQGVFLDVPGLAEPASGLVVSLGATAGEGLNALYLRRGRYPRAGSQDEALASEAFAKANGLAVGDTVRAVMNGRLQPLRLTGVAISPEYIYELGPGQFVPDNRRFGVLWMDRKGLATAFDMDGAFNNVTARLAPGASAPAVLAALDRALAPYGGTGAIDREDQLSHRFLTDEIAQNRTMSRLTPAIFLLVGAFLLYTVLTRLVQMQRSQVGLLKAFGYRAGELGWHYFELALAIAALGAAIGLATGLPFGRAILGMYADYYHFPVVSGDSEAGVAMAGVLLSVVAAALGAVPPALRAARLPPAESMRPEPPPRFHAGALERWGLRRALAPGARIVIRNLARRPLRFAASVAGIGVAVSLLVMTWAMFDGVRYLMQWQFTLVQREDLQVVLTDPRSPSAANELRALPGVLAVEPFRMVPIRIRYGHRSKRAVLFGLEGEASLRRVVDVDARAHALHAEGVLLTAMIADTLRAKAGDVLEVEVLAGARQHLRLPISGIVDEPVGYAAYLPRAAANRLLAEGDVANGAYLRVDPLARASLFARLKSLPLVAGVNLREAAHAHFGEMIERSVGTMNTINLAFAGIIAFGLVYNGARISLSERGYELATLRVLGFTQAETSALLLGEQAAILVAGLPVGLALGLALTLYFIHMLSTQVWRMPYVVTGATYVWSMAAVAGAAALSGALVAWRLRRLDLVAALKARE